MAAALDVSRATVERVRKRFAEAGLEDALRHCTPRREYRRKLDGDQEAHLIALACTPPPAGRRCWTLRLLAGKAVELRYIDGVSYETVRRVLKKNRLKPWLTKRWCIPPEHSGAFVWRMEDVLDVYCHPYDAQRPQICLDEASKQLLADARLGRPAAPGRVRREDYEYERDGVCNLFLWCEPLRGQRHVTVTERRTKVDWAHVIKDLVDEHYPKVERIVLVLDNLHTHTVGSLYEASPAACSAPCVVSETPTDPQRHSRWRPDYPSPLSWAPPTIPRMLHQPRAGTLTAASHGSRQGGGMLNDGRQFLRQAWWLAAFLGAAISLLVLGINLLGDGLRDALDPRLRQ
ncbi:MAG: IS630 family transposase [Chloroflexota bacterium]